MPSTNSSGSVEVTGTGRFITFEGIDGAGKSSHLAWIPAYLGGLGFDVVETREPGGTPLGEQLRALVLAHPMRPETETLMMFAARAQHLADVIEPAIARGALVICDRFTDATFAYQGGGRGLGADRLAILEQWVQQGRQPDRTYLFDLPVGTAETRRLHVRQPDRFEQEKAEFFERVRAAYLARAAADPGRFRRVDASLAFNDIRTWLEHDLRQMVLA